MPAAIRSLAKAKQDERLFYGYRGLVEVSGAVTENMGWNVALTYSETVADIATPDIYVARLDRALRGLGGPNCTTMTTPGANGCLWFNPFSTGVATNAATGEANPQYDPASANSNAVIDWMFEDFCL